MDIAINTEEEVNTTKNGSFLVKVKEFTNMKVIIEDFRNISNCNKINDDVNL